MGALFGKIKKEYSVRGKAGEVKKQIYQFASEMPELEKGLSYLKGFKILSKKRIGLNMFNRHIFTCFFSLKEENEDTKIDVTIRTYIYMEIILVGFLALFITLSGWALLAEDLSIFFKREGAEYVLIYCNLMSAYQFYLNWKRKQNGVKAIDKLMNQLTSHSNQK